MTVVSVCVCVRTYARVRVRACADRPAVDDEDGPGGGVEAALLQRLSVTRMEETAFIIQILRFTHVVFDLIIKQRCV